MLIDINECLVDNGNCSHNCTNTPGSYYCTCKTGYQLESNNHKCLGSNFKQCLCTCYTCIHIYLPYYRIAGFYHEDFNIVFDSICNIKICVIFVKHNILHKCPTVILALFFK